MNEEKYVEMLENGELYDYITNLQQENERLKDQNINEILKKDLEICAKQYKKSEEKLEDYKSRCEKAVEYLKSQEDNLFMSFSDDFLGHDELITKKIGTTLLNILNGRSDE